MFNQPIDDRLSSWAQFRDSLNNKSEPLEDVWEFWKQAPFIPYNNKIDPFHQRSWPSPWEIIVENKYDDFTKAVMMAYTLKYTSRFSESDIQVQNIVGTFDNSKNLAYNVVCVDNKWILNYDDNQPVEVANVPVSFRLENLTVIERPR